MSAKLDRVVGHLRAATAGPTDRQLLHRFAAGGDPVAFATLAGRHGPMVLRVCRRVLRHEHDAEDAFQATFLVLARRAGSIRSSEAVASWLHGVAHRVALRARRDAGRRRVHERAARPLPASGDVDWPEVQAALDEAIRSLPEKYRGPFVLCHLEGKSRREVAAELGLMEGTVWSRLAHARSLLRARLGRRGIELTALLAVVALAQGTVPAGLVAATARAVLTVGGPTARATALAGAVGRTLPSTTASVLVLGVVAAGMLAAGGAPMTTPAPPPEPPAAVKPAPDPADPEQAGRFSGRVSGPDGKPLAGASVYIVPTQGTNTAGPVRARTDADGRFAFDAPDLTYPAFDGLLKRREGFVIATKDGYGPDWTATWGHTTGAGFREWWMPVKGAAIDLRLDRDDVPIHGRFLDPAGKPLAGARVQLTNLGLPYGFNLDTHLDREAKANSARGFLTMPKIYERDTHRVHLIPGLTAETRTDADGRFRLTGVGRDRLARLKVSAPGVLDTTLEVMTRDAADVGTIPDRDGKPTGVIHGAGFTLRLKAGLTVKGLVRDRDTKAPVPGMWVTKYYNPLTDPEATDGVTATDAAGRFTLSGLDPELLNWQEEHRGLTAVPQPGTPYLTARAVVGRDAEVVFECVRGIPFRLKLVDEQGRPAEGTVEYRPLAPNPRAEELQKPLRGTNWPVLMNRAARRPDGRYEGFVLPGPGAVVVEAADRRLYRPALVDPKAFFEPGRTAWPDRAESLYGTRDILATLHGSIDQTGYSAVVLVNPRLGAGPLELTATVVRDRPRTVSLVDPEGKPVVGADSSMRWPTRETQEVLRSATFSLTRLHPDRVKQMTFVKEDRRLVGILLARGDTAAPITVRMAPWATATGRLVDATGKPLAGRSVAFRATDPDVVEQQGAKTDGDGRFRVERLIPGLSYATGGGKPVVFRPDEVRDIGDLRTAP